MENLFHHTEQIMSYVEKKFQILQVPEGKDLDLWIDQDHQVVGQNNEKSLSCPGEISISRR